MAEKVAGTQLVAGPFVLSYPHLVAPQEPEKDAQGKPKGVAKFGAALIALSNTDLAGLQQAVILAAQAKNPGKDVKKMFVRDADGNADLRSPFRTDLEKKGYTKIAGVGKMYFSARANARPGLCLADKSLVALEDIDKYFYAGAKVKVHVSAFWYNNSGNTGVSFGLNNIQFVGHGERLDSRISTDDAFTVEAELGVEGAAGELDSLLGG